MNIVIDIGHPAQVHLFRNLIAKLKDRGDRVLVTSTEKDIALNLLEEYGLDFVNLGPTGKSVLSKILNIPRLDWTFYKAIKDFNPDLFIGSGSFRCGHISRLLGKPCFQMADTEMGWQEHCVYAPFSDRIATPQCFRRDLGKKQVRYNGFQELAYLHPDYFTPDKNTREALSVGDDEDYFIVRFVAWKATHDIGHRGLNLEEKRDLVAKLRRKGKVFITSEAPLEEEFRPFEFPCAKNKFLDALGLASLVVTESNTVATEAALLGVPVIRVNSFVGAKDMGNFIELEQKYDLMYSFKNYTQAENKIEELLGKKDLRKTWQSKKDRLIKDKVDVTAWMYDFIEQNWRTDSQPRPAGR